MVKGLYTAYTGMINEQKRLDVLSNNLANADTNGYKKEGTTSQTFADELAIKIKDTSSYGLAQKLGTISMGVHIGETYTDYSTGSFKVTDNSTDFAIKGDGFFAIAYTDKQGNSSVKYTRDGAFTVNTQGYLVTKDGDYVLNANDARNGNVNGRIQVDPTQKITVDELGNIYQNDQQVGTIGIVDFADYDYLAKYGENMYDLVNGGTVTAADGSVTETHRAVKLTVDGSENWISWTNPRDTADITVPGTIGSLGDILCSHYSPLAGTLSSDAGLYTVSTNTTAEPGKTRIILRHGFKTLALFKEYLKAQADAGTPVTFVYKLTPATETPTVTKRTAEPLCAVPDADGLCTVQGGSTLTVTGYEDPRATRRALEKRIAALEAKA